MWEESGAAEDSCPVRSLIIKRGNCLPRKSDSKVTHFFHNNTLFILIKQLKQLSIQCYIFPHRSFLKSLAIKRAKKTTTIVVDDIVWITFRAI